MPGAGGPLLVLGIGNELLGDDAVGVHAVRLLERGPGLLPAGTQIVDGGTGGLSLLPLVAGAGALVVVDAVDLGAPAGTVGVLAGDDLHADPARLSVHEVGTSDLLAAARLTGALPVDTVLVGMQPGSLEPGLDLSPAVAAALPELLAQVEQWCRTLTGTGVA